MIPNAIKLAFGFLVTGLSWIGIKVFKSGKILNIQVEEDSIGYLSIQLIILLSMAYGAYCIYTVLRRAFTNYQLNNIDKINKS